jgi:hypothetical protein
VLAGKSDLAEIAILSAVDSGVSILAIVDPAPTAPFIGKPVVNSYERFAEPFDAFMITDVVGARGAFEDAVRRLGGERVLAYGTRVSWARTALVDQRDASSCRDLP